MGADADLIGKTIQNIKVPVEKPHFYGAGDASKKIVEILHAQ